MPEGSLAGLLSNVFGSSTENDETSRRIAKARRLMDEVSGGKTANFLAQVDMARGAAEGTADPRVTEGLTTPEELGVADRVAWGQRLRETEGIPTGGLSLLPTIGYEGLKAAAQTGPGAAILKTVGDAFAKVGGAKGEQLGDWFTIDETSSPASFGNVAALLSGYYGR